MLLVIGVLVLGQLIVSKSDVHAATLTDGSVSISNSIPSSTAVSYTFEMSGVTTSPAIRCIQIKIDTQADGAGGVPTAFSSTAAVVTDGSTDFIPTAASWSEDVGTNGTMKFTLAGGESPASAADRTIIWEGISNGSTDDTGYYAILTTYQNTDCSTDEVDTKTVMFIYTAGQVVTLTVDPSLSFALAGVAGSQTVNGETTTVATVTDADTIPLGTVSSSANAVAAHDLTVTTNAAGGYTVFTRYTQVPTSGSDTITDFTGTNGSPASFSAAGTEAFGYTTDDTTLSVTGDGADRFTTPANQWAKFTTGNLEIAYSATSVSSETTRVGYQVGVAGTTEAGTYTTTVIFTATPTY